MNSSTINSLLIKNSKIVFYISNSAFIIRCLALKNFNQRKSNKINYQIMNNNQFQSIEQFTTSLLKVLTIQILFKKFIKVNRILEKIKKTKSVINTVIITQPKIMMYSL